MHLFHRNINNNNNVDDDDDEEKIIIRTRNERN